MWILPEVVLQHAIKTGLQDLKQNNTAFREIFAQMDSPELSSFYGPTYIDDISDWFNSTNIQVMQAFSFDASKLPCYSIHLASENEDESKAAAGDYLGLDDEDYEISVGPVSITIDIGIHGMKDKNHVLWLYYILSNILYRQKVYLTNLGLQIHTFSASDYNKEANKMAENVWSRWVKFKCITQNTWSSDTAGIDHDVDVRVKVARAVPEGVDEEAVDL